MKLVYLFLSIFSILNGFSQIQNEKWYKIYEQNGLKVEIQAPTKQYPSMSMALDAFLKK